MIAGTAWGAFAWLLGARAIGPSVWGGVIASPFIGVGLAGLVHPRFLGAEGWFRGFWALVSVYLGATGFSLACGIFGFLRSNGGRIEVLFEPVIGVLWGVTMTGYLLFLWPLAYLTHWWLESRLEA